VREAERLLKMEVKLLPALDGKARPDSADEALELAWGATVMKHFAAAARLHANAFALNPELEKDWRKPHGFDGACCAALVGCGRGEDAARLSDAERSRWRQQALDGLRALLAQMANAADSGKPQDRTQAAANLRILLRTPSLADVRDEAALARLPEAEREAWQRFWKDVQALLVQVTEKTGKSP
jgi:hypothetical protein